MPCNHEFLEQHLDAVLEDTLTEEQKTQLHSCLKDCSQCSGVYAQSKQYLDFAHEWQQQNPGEWNRKLFPMRLSSRRSIRQTHIASGWWHWGALTTTACALVLVMLNTQISIHEGVHITFGATSEAELQKMLAEELSLSQEQHRLTTEAMLQEYLGTQTSQQELLVNALLEQTRKERSDEYTFLYSALQNQRLSDQQYINQRLNLLTDNQIESNQYLNTLATAVSVTNRPTNQR